MESGKWISEVADGYGTTLEITEHLFSKKSAFQQIDIYFNFIGQFELPKVEPTPEELAEMERLRKRRLRNKLYTRRYREKKKAEKLAAQKALEEQREKEQKQADEKSA